MGFSILTTAMPNVWVEADHQCILWCNQLVKSVSRALNFLIDPITQQNTANLSDRMAIFRRSFVSELPSSFSFNSSALQRSNTTSCVKDRKERVYYQARDPFELSHYVDRSQVVHHAVDSSISEDSPLFLKSFHSSEKAPFLFLFDYSHWSLLLFPNIFTIF